MSKLYDYLLTFYKVLVGLVTTKRLIMVALCALGFYLIWVSCSLISCFQRKFSKRCSKLYDFVRKNKMDSNNLRIVDMMAEKISSGFYHGWKKFKTSANAKPSDFITRREALEVEVNGGVLNQGKTFMRSFIAISTAILFMFNLAYLGNDATITSYLIAESMMLPLVYYVVMKLFYFLYTSIKQQLYKQSVESFYNVVGLLDEVFGANQVMVVPAAQEVAENAEVETDESAELENNEETQEAEAVVEEDEEPENSLDRYDVFKKKNIDVDKIINEVPHNTGTNLPYINVDSDYVIKDEGGAESLGKIVTDQDDASSILGGMMQDRASLKKNNSNFLDVDKDIAQIDNEKLEEATQEKEEPKVEEESKVEESATEESNESPMVNLEDFAVAENADKVAETEEKTEDVTAEPENAEPEPVVEEKPVEEPAKEEVVEEKPEVIVPEPPAEEEIQKEAIANVVSGFKSNRSKLASGGVIIERNEPIARRERPVIVEEPAPATSSVIDDFNDMNTAQSYYQAPQPQQNVVQQLSAENNTDDILNSIKTSAGGYEYGYQAPTYETPGYGAQPNYGGYNAGYVQQNTPSYGAGYGAQTNYTGYNAGYVQQNNPYAQMNQTPYGQNFESYEEVDEFEEEFEEDVEETPTKSAKKIRTKENEPRPRNLKKKVASKVEENVTPAKTRGRPKKQEVSESMTIKNDKEFNEVLSRAEKLMRKSEEGLSASQSKRIEKELKMLMDAMSRYKESK